MLSVTTALVVVTIDNPLIYTIFSQSNVYTLYTQTAVEIIKHTAQFSNVEPIVCIIRQNSEILDSDWPDCSISARMYNCP